METWTIIGTIATLIGMIIALIQLYKINRNVKRSFSPILILDTSRIGSEPMIKFNQAFEQYPVVERVSFKLRNDGNGPAFNIDIKVRQGTLILERSIHPSWSQRSIPASELNRKNLGKNEEAECFFKITSGFTPPREGKPLTIEVICKNMYCQTLSFRFHMKTDMLSALAEESEILFFDEMKGF